MSESRQTPWVLLLSFGGAWIGLGALSIIQVSEINYGRLPEVIKQRAECLGLGMNLSWVGGVESPLEVEGTCRGLGKSIL